jgi:hypothetical protein
MSWREARSFGSLTTKTTAAGRFFVVGLTLELTPRLFVSAAWSSETNRSSSWLISLSVGVLIEKPSMPLGVVVPVPSRRANVSQQIHPGRLTPQSRGRLAASRKPPLTSNVGPQVSRVPSRRAVPVWLGRSRCVGRGSASCRKLGPPDATAGQQSATGVWPFRVLRSPGVATVLSPFAWAVRPSAASARLACREACCFRRSRCESYARVTGR